MGNRMFERFPRGFYAPVYNRFDPQDLFGERTYKMRIPACTIDHYHARLANFHEVSPFASNGSLPSTAATSPVTYSSGVDASVRLVSEYAIKVVEKAVAAAGIKGAVITSTLRVPQRQAEIMYGEASKNLAGQYALYGKAGDQVLDVFKENKDSPKGDVIKLMKEKIEEIHAKGLRVSLHVSTVEQYSKLNVFDIGVNSTKAVAGNNFSIIKLTAAFQKLVKDGYIKRLIDETNKTNHCWHLEIVPGAKVL